MPSESRRFFVTLKIKSEFKKSKKEKNSETAFLMFRLGHTQLETIQVQAAHLLRFYPDDRIPEHEIQTQEQQQSSERRAKMEIEWKKKQEFQDEEDQAISHLDKKTRKIIKEEEEEKED